MGNREEELEEQDVEEEENEEERQEVGKGVGGEEGKMEGAGDQKKRRNNANLSFKCGWLTVCEV